MSCREESFPGPGAGSPPPHRALHAACGGITWLLLRPMRVPPLPTPRALGLPYRPLRFRSGSVELSGWHIPHPDSRAGIVLCHGHNNSRVQFRRMLRPLHAAGFHLLLFDFRAMGASGGRFCTFGYEEQLDVAAAVAWLRETAGVERVGLYGRSMGGASALLAAARDPQIGAVVTDCAFARLDEMIEQRFLFLPDSLRAPVGGSVRRWAERWCGPVLPEVAPEAALAAWEPRPLLVIHGERDALVPPEHGRRLAAAGGRGAELWLVPGAGHVACERRARERYTARVTDHFRRHLLDAGA